MFKKIFVALSLSTFLTSLSFAEDLLAFYTNGKLTENSPGVKVLSLDEKKQVKGGYYDSLYTCGVSQCFAFADHQTAIKNGTFTPAELTAWRSATLETTSTPEYSSYFVGFMAQNNWSVSSLGKPYNYFTYAAVMLDKNGNIYKLSSQVLNNNLIVRQLSIKYKDQFDRHFGGLQSRAIGRIAK